jgi:hypothetical protein
MTSEGESRPRHDGCPLPFDAQTQNLWIYALCFWIQYLAAPITYVGKNQAALCRGLGADDFYAGLPATVYFSTSFLPIFWAWFVPYVSWLKRNAVACYAVNATALAAVPLGLFLGAPAAVNYWLVVVQCAVAGVMMNAAAMFLWEGIARGLAASRRGFTLGVTFGAGPFLAVLGSLLSQVILPPAETTSGASSGFLPFPYNFALMYALCVPMMVACAILCGRLIVPLPERELTRKTFAEGVLGGAVKFVANPVLLVALVVITLTYTTNLMDSNMGLYTQEALGEKPEAYSGYQNALRFGTKAFAGLFLGWLLANTHAKAGVLATVGFYLASQLWAIFVTGPWYLVAFGLYGAGELIGVYGPNYVLTASRQADIRRNMSFVTMFSTLSSPAGLLFGGISDHYGKTALGYQMGFAVCASFVGFAWLLALVALPARPQPKEDLQLGAAPALAAPEPDVDTRIQSPPFNIRPKPER